MSKVGSEKYLKKEGSGLKDQFREDVPCLSGVMEESEKVFGAVGKWVVNDDIISRARELLT